MYITQKDADKIAENVIGFIDGFFNFVAGIIIMLGCGCFTILALVCVIIYLLGSR